MRVPVPSFPKPNFGVSAPDDGMSLFEHLDELRRRAFAIVIALVVCTVVGVVFGTPVIEFLQAPYGREFTVLGPTGGVTAYFKVALTVGGILASPVITYQMLMFVLPGLTGREKRLVLFSLPPIALLFIVGVLFAWYILVPPALGFLEGFQPTLFKPEWTPDLYLGFVTSLIFWMGVAFETPLIFFVVALLGFVGAGALLRNWRIAIVGAAIAAAAITPTVDPVNMALVMGPLLTLYGVSIALVALAGRMRRRAEASTPEA